MAAESQQKGNLLEDLVASLLRPRFPDVETRIQLPVLRHPERKPREINVLVTIPGPTRAPLRIAFECRNRKKPVDPDQVAAFKLKLEDVGLPVVGSVMVTTTKFTSGGQGAAEALGINPLVAEGLTEDRLA